MGKKLTIKQEKFCLKFINCGDASEAYRHAYNAKNMKPETINKRASELCLRGEIKGRIEELRAKIEKESLWTVDKLIKAHTRVYEIGIGDVASSHIAIEGAGDGVSNAREVDMRDTNLAGAKASLVEIGKLLGYYTEKLKVEGELSLKDFIKTRENK